MMTLLTACPVDVDPAASDPSPFVVELTELRQRMVRDLEQFLSLELTNPHPISLPRVFKSATVGITGTRAIADGASTPIAAVE